RNLVLAALREVYDGKWERNVGIGGGHTLAWFGRITIVGACTTAWDTAHLVIAIMGDRFVVVLADSAGAQTRIRSAGMAASNGGQEFGRGPGLAVATGGLHPNASPEEYFFPPAERTRLINLANIVTWARTGVERDYRGYVTDVHASEMPTRLSKQLAMLV